MDTSILGPMLGGALIGLSAVGLLFFHGKIAGISGIVGGLFGSLRRGDVGWRVAFVLGLVSAGLVGAHWAPEQLAMTLERSLGAVALAGLLVGLGSRLGNGCTSGHGVCGIARLSRRSIAATLTFMTTGALTVFVVNHLLGGAL